MGQTHTPADSCDAPPIHDALRIGDDSKSSGWLLGDEVSAEQAKDTSYTVFGAYQCLQFVLA
jgi:hypothetical protein